jgi:hypothetical protein
MHEQQQNHCHPIPSIRCVQVLRQINAISDKKEKEENNAVTFPA